MKLTINQFAQVNGFKREVAYHLIQFLREQKVIKEAGTAPKAEKSKGRPEIIYAGDNDKIRAVLALLKFE